VGVSDFVLTLLAKILPVCGVFRNIIIQNASEAAVAKLFREFDSFFFRLPATRSKYACSSIRVLEARRLFKSQLSALSAVLCFQN